MVGMKTNAGHHSAGRDVWSRKLRRGKRSFSGMKPQQFDHDDGQMMHQLSSS
jgi:hypothetical protein